MRTESFDLLFIKLVYIAGLVHERDAEWVKKILTQNFSPATQLVRVQT